MPDVDLKPAGGLRPRCSWIIPAFNDAGNLSQALRRSHAFLTALNTTFEILLVDDGSTDSTPEIAANLALSYPEIRLLRHNQNRGYGATLATGFRNANATDFVGYTDGDAQYDPADFLEPCRRSLSATHELRAIIGFKQNRAEGISRKFQSALFNRLIRTLFGLQVKDINCSLKWFPASVVSQIHWMSQQGFVDVEILLALQRAGIPIEEIRVRHFPRPDGRGLGGSPLLILRTLTEIWNGYRLLRRGDGPCES